MELNNLPQLADIQTLPEMVESFEARVEKIKKAASVLMTLELTKENDVNIASHINAFKLAFEDIQAKRMPITRKLDDFKKMFTSLENEIKKINDSLQDRRNEFAKIELEKQRAKDLELQKKLEVEELKAQASDLIRKKVANAVENMVNRMVTALKTVTVDNRDSKLEGLSKMSARLTNDLYDKLKIDLVSRYSNDVDSIVNEAKNNLKYEMFKYYEKQIVDAKNECAHLIKNLDTNVDASSKVDLIKDQNNEMITKGAAQDSAKMQGAETALIIDSIENEELKVKQSYKIVVDNDIQYASICAFWFASCSKDFKGNWLTKTIQSMILDLERLANKTGEMLEGVRYEEIVKAK